MTHSLFKYLPNPCAIWERFSKAFQPQNHASVLVINYFVVSLANPQTDSFCPPGTQITKLTLTALASYPSSQGAQKSREGQAIACFPT